eukprot:15474764-Alexandrium_andersonii.AAC.1
MGPKSRCRFAGPADAIADALAPVAQKLGRSFTHYPENNGARVEVPAVKQAAPILAALRALQPNLSFPRSVVQESVRKLQARFRLEAAWAVREPDID